MEEKNGNAGQGGLDSLMRSTVEKIHEMADANTIVGEPIHTPDGVTLIPISRVSFGSGGGSYGKNNKDGFAGGGAAGVRIDPVAFLTIRDGVTRILPVGMAPVNTVDRIVDMAPDLVDKVEGFLDRRAEKKNQSEKKAPPEEAD